MERRGIDDLGLQRVAPVGEVLVNGEELRVVEIEVAVVVVEDPVEAALFGPRRAATRRAGSASSTGSSWAKTTTG